MSTRTDFMLRKCSRNVGWLAICAAAVIACQPSRALATVSIDTEPQDTESCDAEANNTVQFFIEASGTGTISFVWQFDDGGGFATVDDTGDADITVITNAGDSTLEIANFEAADVGSGYRCLVSDDDDTDVPSVTAVVALQAPPVANAGPDQNGLGTNVCAGDDIQLDGSASSDFDTQCTWDAQFGNGSFDDENALDTFYTPSQDDIDSGFVFLRLTCPPIAPCAGQSQDAMIATFQPTPNADLTVDALDNPLCVGESTSVTVSGSEAGVTYQLRNDDGDANVGDPVDGDGNTIELPTGTLNTSTTFNILTSSACPAVKLTQTQTITVNADPTVEAGTGQATCQGEAVAVNLDGSSTSTSSCQWTGGEGLFGDDTDPQSTYTPSPAESDTGDAVELTLTCQPIPPCDGAVVDTMNVTFTQLAPTANANTDQSVCETDTDIQLSGACANEDSILWTTGGDGAFDDDSIEDADYTPGAGDISNGSVTLTLTCNAIDPCVSAVADDMIMTFAATPTAEAGTNQNSCQGQVVAVTLGGSTSDSNGCQWTGGEGDFGDETDPQSTYTPSGAESDAGNAVTLTLTCQPNAPCAAQAIDTMDVTFPQAEPTAEAGANQPSCLGQVVSVELFGSTSNSSSCLWTGGNGEFDGASSPGSEYTPTQAEADAGVNVTLTLTCQPIAPCDTEVVDTMDVTFLQSPPTAVAGADPASCQGQVVAVDLDGSTSNSDSCLWTGGDGDGSFGDDTNVQTTYTPSQAEADAGDAVTLTLTCQPTAPCETEISDTVDVTFPQAEPIVSADEDQDICEDEFVLLNGSTSNSTGCTWTTDGDGVFFDANALDAVYFPGEEDVEVDGGATLTLTCDPVAPCDTQVVDTMDFTLQLLPVPDAGDNTTSCEGDPAVLNGSQANDDGCTWTTDGDGSFDDENDPDTNYNPGTNDIDAGNPVTLTLTCDSIDPCGGSVIDTTEMTFQDGPTTDAGGDQDVCEGNVQLAGATANSVGCEWTTNGTGSFDEDTNLDAVYTPTEADIDNGVTLTLTCEGTPACPGEVADTMDITYQREPTADAGSDDAVCETTTFQLGGGASLSTGCTWSTDGDGSFDDANALDAVYTPGAGDIANETAELTLTCTPIAPCAVDATNSMDLTIQPLPIVDAGDLEVSCREQNPPSVPLVGSASNVDGCLWTGGDGEFDDDEEPNTSYTPSQAEADAGDSVILTLSCASIAPCTDEISDTVRVEFQNSPSVSAGPAKISCNGNPVTLAASAASNSGCEWDTDGDGAFDDITLLNAEYTPGATDIANGVVELELFCDPINPCGTSVFDPVLVTIVASADTDDDTICDNVDNCLSISNTDQADADSDNVGDVCDNCPQAANSEQLDGDEDTVGDACDNCPSLANTDQLDSDNNGVGNLCEPPPPPPPPDDEPDDEETPESDTADEEGNVEVSNEDVDVIIEGLEEGTDVMLETDEETGETTLTIGDEENPDLVLMVDGLDQGADIALTIDEQGDQSLVLTNADGSEALNLDVGGLGQGANIDVSIDEAGDQTVVLSGAGGSTTTLDLNSLPPGSNVAFSTDDAGNVTVAVNNESGEAVDVTIVATGAGDNVTFVITYNPPPPANLGGARIIPGFEGFVNTETLGGSVTVSASGLTLQSVVTMKLEYDDADLANINENDLRLLRLNTETGAFEAPGTNDVGVSPSTGVLGDFGVRTNFNSAWAEVSELGTFAVGLPQLADQPDVPTDVPPTDQPPTQDVPDTACGAGAAPCGVVGMINWFLMVSGLFVIRTRFRRFSPQNNQGTRIG